MAFGRIVASVAHAPDRTWIADRVLFCPSGLAATYSRPTVGSGDGSADPFELWSAELGGLHIAWNRTDVQFGAGTSAGSPASGEDVAPEAEPSQRNQLEVTGAGVEAVRSTRSVAL